MSQENVELVQSLYAAFLNRDVAYVASKLAPDFVISQSKEVPWGGTYHGVEGLQQFFAALTLNLRNEALPIERFLDAGDHVVAIGRTQGTILKNGRRFDVPLAHVWQIRDGVAVRFMPYIDHPTMHAALVG